jgi:hypothetical protein
VSPDLRVALHPEQTYRELISQAPPPSWHAVGRILLVLLVIAVGVTVAAVHRITASLVLTTAIVWSPIVAIQVAIGVAVIGTASQRRVGFVRALDLWFAGHLPYSLWVLALPVVAMIPAATPHELIAMSIVVPLVWTTLIVTAFCRVVLDLSPRAARRHAAFHLAMACAIGGALVVWAAGGPAALVSYLLRRLIGA